MLTRVFYFLIGGAASLALFIFFYWSLTLTSSIGMLKEMTAPTYFWSYTLLTLGTIVLFGANAALVVYQWRRVGPPRLRGQAGTGLGALVGLGASACPVCGAILLSAIGIAGGLASFPFQGLELKALSFGLMALPVWIITSDLRRANSRCGDCAQLRDPSYSASDRPWLVVLLALVTVFAFVSAMLLKIEF